VHRIEESSLLIALGKSVNRVLKNIAACAGELVAGNYSFLTMEIMLRSLDV